MKRFFVAALVVLSLGGCTALNRVYSAVSGSTVDTTTVYIGANSFDAVEITATKYLRLPRCTSANRPVCRDPKATAALIPAVRSARDARKALVQYSLDHPGQLGPQGLYDALRAAGSTLQNVLNDYHIAIK